MLISIAPCRDHTSKALRYGTHSQNMTTPVSKHIGCDWHLRMSLRMDAWNPRDVYVVPR